MALHGQWDVGDELPIDALAAITAHLIIAHIEGAEIMRVPVKLLLILFCRQALCGEVFTLAILGLRQFLSVNLQVQRREAAAELCHRGQVKDCLLLLVPDCSVEP